MYDDDFSNDYDWRDDEIQSLMEDYDLDEEQAERIRDLMDEYGVEAEEALEMEDLL